MTTDIHPNAPLSVTLGDGLIPLDREGVYVPNHVDERGIVHWFSVVEVSEAHDSNRAHQLRYFRAVRADDGRLIHDSHPVMPFAPSSAPSFPLLQLQSMLEDGELADAQELAYQAARLHGLPFPEPENLPDLPAGIQYGFGGGLTGDSTFSLEAFRDGHQVQPVQATRQSMPLARRSEAVIVNPQTRNDPVEQREPEAAFIDADGEVGTQPLAPYTLEPDRAVQQFRNRFAESPHRLLEPLDPVVNYSFDVALADPWTLELSANKWWFDQDRNIVHDLQPLNAYSLESFEFEREIEQEQGAMDRESLEHTYHELGLEAAMRRAEAMAVANEQLDPNRADGRLFQQGPPDRFTTLREAELAGLDARAVIETWRDISDDETQELPTAAPKPGSWQELLAQPSETEPEPERRYWQLHYRPVETPDGTRFGTALFVTEFPQLPPDFDDYVEAYGMDDSIYPTEARTLEMAHFASDDEARKFAAEFQAYLVPGLLDGPELAPEVAKLEGLPGTWEAMDYRDIVDYMSGKQTIVRELEEWHPHSSNAEHDARIEAEGLSTDPIRQFTTFDEDEEDQRFEPAAPDFDL